MASLLSESDEWVTQTFAPKAGRDCTQFGSSKRSLVRFSVMGANELQLFWSGKHIMRCIMPRDAPTRVLLFLAGLLQPDRMCSAPPVEGFVLYALNPQSLQP